jgi:hypothetical protein
MFLKSWLLSLEGWKPLVEVLYGACIVSLKLNLIFCKFFQLFCHWKPRCGSDPDSLLRLDPDPH